MVSMNPRHATATSPTTEDRARSLACRLATAETDLALIRAHAADLAHSEHPAAAYAAATAARRLEAAAGEVAAAARSLGAELTMALATEVEGSNVLQLTR